jgi:hypothetical protein
MINESQKNLNASFEKPSQKMIPEYSSKKVVLAKTRQQIDLEREKKGELFMIAAKKVNKDFKKKRMDEMFHIN